MSSRAGARLGVAAGVAAAAAFCAIAFARQGASPPREGDPVLRLGLVIEDGSARPTAADAATTARATAAAVAALSTDERDVLRAALDELATRAEVRGNPLAEDLEDGEPGEALSTASGYFLPTFTAARSMAAGRWVADGGGFVVRAVADCAGETRRCVRVFGDDAARTPEERRALFLAWPLATSAIVRAPDRERASRVARAIRGRVHRADSRIALVLTGADLRGEDPASDAIRTQARRVLHAIRGEARGAGLRAIGLLAGDPAAGPLAPFLHLADEEILIVPRMGALSRWGDVVAEVNAKVAPFEASDGVRWVRRPTPLRE